MKILKLHRLPASVKIAYERASAANADQIDTVQFSSADLPRPELDEALAALVPHVLEILELPKGYSKNLTITGISLSHKGGATKAVVRGKKELQSSAGVFNIATPLKPMAQGDDGEGEDSYDVLTDEAAEAVDRVIAEAKLYVKGERAQGSLDLQDSE